MAPDIAIRTEAPRTVPDRDQGEGQRKKSGVKADRVVGGDVEHATRIGCVPKSGVSNQWVPSLSPLARTGRSTYIAAPPPGPSPARILPRCCSTIHRAIDSPSPAPGF